MNINELRSKITDGEIINILRSQRTVAINNRRAEIKSMNETLDSGLLFELDILLKEPITVKASLQFFFDNNCEIDDTPLSFK